MDISCLSDTASTSAATAAAVAASVPFAIASSSALVSLFLRALLRLLPRLGTRRDLGGGGGEESLCAAAAVGELTAAGEALLVILLPTITELRGEGRLDADANAAAVVAPALLSACICSRPLALLFACAACDAAANPRRPPPPLMGRAAATGTVVMSCSFASPVCHELSDSVRPRVDGASAWSHAVRAEMGERVRLPSVWSLRSCSSHACASLVSPSDDRWCVLAVGRRPTGAEARSCGSRLVLPSACLPHCSPARTDLHRQTEEGGEEDGRRKGTRTGPRAARRTSKQRGNDGAVFLPRNLFVKLCRK